MNRFTLPGLVTSFMGLALTAFAQSSAPLQVIQVPTIINIHTANGSPVTTAADARAAVAAANTLLKQAGIRLHVVKVNMGDENPSTNPANPANAGNTDNDASMTDAEFKAAQAAGNKELDGDANVGSGKGHKIYFTYAPEDGSTDTVGLAVHYNRTTVVSPILTGSRGDTPAQVTAKTGETIAHEFGHAATLSAGHTVGAGSHADGGGHVDDDDNIMTASGFGATEFTPDQVDEMRRLALRWGQSTAQPAPNAAPVPVPHQSGGAQDDLDDFLGPQPFYDISTFGIYSTQDEPALVLHGLLAGAVLEGEPINAQYRWLFDADGNPGTGAVIEGLPGIDREVAVTANGNGIDPPLIEAAVIDHAAGGLLTPIGGAEFTNELLHDHSQPGPYAQRVEIEVDKGLLDLTAPLVPVTVISSDGFQLQDMLQFHFDPMVWAGLPVLGLDPALPRMGDVVQFSATGLTPGSTAALSLDGVVALDGLLVEPDGTVTGAFDLCSVPDASDFYFVNLEDDTGRSGFTSLPVAPWDEDFDDFLPGGAHGQDGWKGWDDDPAFDAPVTGAIARSGDSSVDIFGGSDLVREHCNSDNGAWSYTAWQYIPTDFVSGGSGQYAGSHFALLNTYQDGGPYKWSVAVQAHSPSQQIKVYNGNEQDTNDIPIQTDRWVKIQVIVDLDDDWTYVYYDDELTAEYIWTGGVIGEGDGALDIAAVDLWANGSSSVYYDDLRLEPIIGCGDLGGLGSDADHDGSSLLDEFRNGTNSCDPDSDGDTVPDGEDNCPSTANPEQTDGDNDGIGDICDDVDDCPADVNGDSVVNVTDLLEVINNWGNCPGCPADITGDGVVNVQDLVVVITAWGGC